MKQPKFRAYDVQWDTMYYSHEHNGSPFECRVELYHGEWEIQVCDIHENDIGTVRVDGKKYILMQYTGMTDKNGQELCVDDIINNWGEIEHIKDMEEVGFRALECTLIEGDFEIIGNIYETPNKLKENDKEK